MSYQIIVVMYQDGIMCIVFNWFEVMNVLNCIMWFEIVQVFNDLFEDMCCVVLIGMGCVFCLGQDLIDVEVGLDVGCVLCEEYELMLVVIIGVCVLVIVVVNGVVVGVGVNLVLVVDVVIVMESVVLI